MNKEKNQMKLAVTVGALFIGHFLGDSPDAVNEDGGVRDRDGRSGNKQSG